MGLPGWLGSEYVWMRRAERIGEQGALMPSQLRLLVVLVGLLAIAEVVVLGLYVGEVKRSGDALLRLEYAHGAAIIANARASRCVMP
jgi:hypothetical protein